MRIRMAAILGCFILALASTPALAKKKKRKSAALGPVVTVSAIGNSTSAQGQVSTATATCPPRTVAMGGGFTSPLTDTTTMVVERSFRSSDTSWTVSGRNFAGTASVTGHAYCRRAPRPITHVTATGLIPSGILMSGTAGAQCPSNLRLIGGGFETTAGPGPGQQSFPQVSATTAEGIWTVRGLNNNLGAQTVTAHAYCLGGIRPPTVVATTNTGTVAPAGSVSTTSPACPNLRKKPKKSAAPVKKRRKKRPRQVLSAGGFLSPIPLSGDLTTIYADSRIGSGGWLATGVGSGPNAGTLSVTSQGICV
jgi:hypothetical protein